MQLGGPGDDLVMGHYFCLYKRGIFICILFMYQHDARIILTHSYLVFHNYRPSSSFIVTASLCLHSVLIHFLGGPGDDLVMGH